MTSFDSYFRAAVVSACVCVWMGSPARADIIYASNFGNNTITAYDFTTGVPLGTVVTAGAEADGFNGLQVVNGNFVVAAQNTNNLVQYSSSGRLLDTFDSGNTAGLSSPQGVALGRDGKLYVASAANDLILKYDSATLQSLGTFADLSGQGHLGPIDLAFGPDGNLYVTTFDDDRILKIDGHTGAVLGNKTGPAGIGFGPAAFGLDGKLYAIALDLSTFAGTVYRYDPLSDALSLFIAAGAGGLQSPGGITFGPDGNLLVSSLPFDLSVNDVSSTILKYNGLTGAPLGTVVGPGNGLNIPFFIITAATPVPEPGTLTLVCTALLLAFVVARRGRPRRANLPYQV